MFSVKKKIQIWTSRVSHARHQLSTLKWTFLNPIGTMSELMLQTACIQNSYIHNTTTNNKVNNSSCKTNLRELSGKARFAQ